MLTIKLSGELLASSESPIDYTRAQLLAHDINEVIREAGPVVLVIGGGNLWRGRSNAQWAQVQRDSIGIYATCMNALALHAALQKENVDVVLFAPPSYTLPNFSHFSETTALQYLTSGTSILFAGGLGTSGFSTDAVAALRSGQLGIKTLHKVTQTDGVYTADPKIDPTATKLRKVSYATLYRNGCTIMDACCYPICEQYGIKTHVCRYIPQQNSLSEALFTGGSWITLTGDEA